MRGFHDSFIFLSYSIGVFRVHVLFHQLREANFSAWRLDSCKYMSFCIFLIVHAFANASNDIFLPYPSVGFIFCTLLLRCALGLAADYMLNFLAWMHAMFLVSGSFICIFYMIFP